MFVTELRNNILSKINLRNGNTTYNAFKLDLAKSPYDQKHLLKEDLIQIEYGHRYVVDVGWYPSTDPKGFFLVMVLEDFDWDEPLLKLKVKKFEDFIQSLQKAIDFLAAYKKENSNKPYRESWYDFKGFSESESG